MRNPSNDSPWLLGPTRIQGIEDEYSVAEEQSRAWVRVVDCGRTKSTGTRAAGLKEWTGLDVDRAPWLRTMTETERYSKEWLKGEFFWLYRIARDLMQQL